MDDKYKNGKIYKIVNSINPKCYIGSTTTELRKRFYNHKSKSKCGTSLCSSRILFEEDFDNCKIVLVESYPCNNKDELTRRERYWIETTECVNRQIPTRTRQEHYQDNKEHIKRYCELNKQRRREYQKEYYQKKIFI